MTMQPESTLKVRCREELDTLTSVRGWCLNEAERQTLVAGLLPYLAPHCSDAELSCSIIAYYADHELVEALRNRMHPNHDDAWTDWMRQVLMILHCNRLAWSGDAAADCDDLAQVARMELVRALPKFRYASRFLTWAHQVVVLSVKRYLRDSYARKRAVRPESLDLLSIRVDLATESAVMDQAVEARLLIDRVEAILTSYPDERMIEIFWLWACADQRVEEIGGQMQLSVSRVRTLLANLRSYLCQHPEIRDWRSGHAEAIGDLPATCRRQPGL